MTSQDGLNGLTCSSRAYLDSLLEHSPEENYHSDIANRWKQTDKDRDLAYEILDVSQREIRLLHIEADHDGHTQCHLKRHKLDSLPPYRALSYMWGPDQPLTIINVEGCAFQIRQNLYAFLELYKRRHLSEYIWIDQLCINQHDLMERNSQVQLMGEIYSKAQEVLIWLNPPQYHWETFRDWSRKLCRIGDACDSCKRIFGFGYNDYWSRMWIIQEVLMAKKLTVYYGVDILDWQHISQLVWAETRPNDWFSSWIHSTFCWMLKTHHDVAFLKHRQVSLGDLVFSSQKNQCSEARDLLYSLQGLVQDDVKVCVDYDRPMLEVVLDGAVMLLRECGDDRATFMSSNIRHLSEVMLSKELDIFLLYDLEKRYFQEKVTMPREEALSKFRDRLRDEILQHQPSVRRVPSWPKKSYFMSG